MRRRRTRRRTQKRYPDSELSLLDVDAFALESSRLTLARNGLSANLIAGTGIESAPEGLSAIVSNPPFHQGVHTDYQASENLLSQAARHLLKGASCAWWPTVSSNTRH